MSIVRAICQAPVLPAVVGAGGNFSAPAGPSNPFPAFEAAQTVYAHADGGYDGPLPDPSVAAATLTTVDAGNNALSQPLPDFTDCASLFIFEIGANATFVGTLDCSVFPATLGRLAFSSTGVSAISGLSGITSLDKLTAESTSLSALPDVAALTALTEIYFANNTVTSWAGTVFPNNLIMLDMTNCGMSSALVDTLLVALAAATATNGYASFAANTAPGASGLAAKTTLESRGWTVDVDL